MNWKASKHHSPTDFKLKKKFVVVDVLGVHRLAYRKDAVAGDDVFMINSSTIPIDQLRFLATDEKLFDIIDKAHEECGHGMARMTWNKCEAQ